MRGLWVLWLAAACGPGLSHTEHASRDVALSALTGASTSTPIGDLLRDSVVNGGLWFDDPECVEQFAVADEVKSQHLAAFARCLGGLHLRVSTRRDPFVDVFVLTYGPGIEIEARIVEDDLGPRLTWIGYESRRDTSEGLLTITPEALEAQRAGGDRNALPASVASELGDTAAFAWLDICLDAAGTIADARVREASSLKAGRALAGATADWRFRPFIIGGHPVPVCAMVRVDHPAKRIAVETLPMPSFDDDDAVILAADAMSKRLTGDPHIVPDDIGRNMIAHGRVPQVISAFKLCVDETGHVASLRPIRSTGIPRYDQKIIREMSDWTYAPYVDDGHPAPACVAVTFVYRQRVGVPKARYLSVGDER
jgi:hypothetical protein